jgi:hypothetical protein
VAETISWLITLLKQLHFNHDFLSQQNNRLILILSELMDYFVAGQDSVVPFCFLVVFYVGATSVVFYVGATSVVFYVGATMVTMGGDLQPGCLADRPLTGLGQPLINP